MENIRDINKYTIIYDTENWHDNADDINPLNAKFRFFGWFDYSLVNPAEDDDGFRVTHDINQIKKVIAGAKILVGLNNREYDNKILERLGVDLNYKIIVDLMQILKPKEDGGKGRSSIIVVDGKNMKDTIDGYSMEKIGRWLKLKNQKQDDFDYSILKKQEHELTEEEKKYIYSYLKQDLETTKDIYEFLENYFGNMRAYLSAKDNDKKEYLRSTTATYAYKVVCNYTGMKEEYGDGKRQEFKGAFVLQPTKEEYKGDIYCFDFSSLYPNIFFQCNLFSQVADGEEGWNGGGMWVTQGTYNDKQRGKIETVLHTLFNKRLELKAKKDPAEYGIKIFMNCFSEDSYILTTKGVKLVKDCKVGEMVYSINKTTGRTELKPITHTHAYNYDGDMINFKTLNTDLLVTPNHNSLYEKDNKIFEKEAKDFLNTKGKFPSVAPIRGKIVDRINILDFIKDDNYEYFVKLKNPYSERKNDKLSYHQYKRLHQSGMYMSNINGEWYIRSRAKENLLPINYNIKDFMYLIGFYLAEGSCYISKDKTINGFHRGVSYMTTLHQDTPIYREKIQKILDNMNLRYIIEKKTFRICGKPLYDFFQQYKNKSDNIKIPEWVFEYDNSILQYLHDGLYDGDGDKRFYTADKSGYKRYRYSTNSKQLADDMVKLNLHLGFRTSISTDNYVKQNGEKCIMYRVHRVKKHGFDKKDIKTIKNTTNKVFCVTVADNHSVYAGRNGKFNWSGQSLYGAVSSPVFKNIHNYTAAEDCTQIGQQWIKYVIDTFKEKGYIVIYSDTDSIYLQDPFQDGEKLFALRDEIINFIKSTIPFPNETFDLKLETKIKYIKFFIGKKGELIKKNYIYITDKDKMVIKGLQLIKANTSKISKQIFEEHLKPQIMKNLICEFDEKYMLNLIDSYKDLNLLAQQIKVKKPATYEIEARKKGKEATSGQYKIALKFGEGRHRLLKVKSKGNNDYVRPEDFKGKITDLDLSHIFETELGVFIKKSDGKVDNKWF